VPIEFGKKFLVVEFTDDGAEFTPVGYAGKGCRQATAPFQDALGGKVLSTEDRKADENDVCVSS
jgi:hypothetical protein